MVERAGRAGFLLEATKTVRIVGMRGRQDLDRNLPAQARILGAIHLAHCAGANCRDDLIGAEPRAWIEFHGARL